MGPARAGGTCVGGGGCRAAPATIAIYTCRTSVYTTCKSLALRTRGLPPLAGLAIAPLLRSTFLNCCNRTHRPANGAKGGLSASPGLHQRGTPLRHCPLGIAGRPRTPPAHPTAYVACDTRLAGSAARLCLLPSLPARPPRQPPGSPAGQCPGCSQAVRGSTDLRNEGQGGGTAAGGCRDGAVGGGPPERRRRAALVRHTPPASVAGGPGAGRGLCGRAGPRTAAGGPGTRGEWARRGARAQRRLHWTPCMRNLPLPSQHKGWHSSCRQP